MSRSDLPPLDAHAHIAGDVTQLQLDSLGDAVVIAMTGSLAEARFALRANGATSPRVVWSAGTHPGDVGALSRFRVAELAALIDLVAVVGEVGLDRRGERSDQGRVFDEILEVTSARPVILSVHSTGRRSDVLDALEMRPPAAAVLHWFTGTSAEIERAAEMGCYFSVNAAMSAEVLLKLPVERVLTETDFPASRRSTLASRPGDTHAAEVQLQRLWSADARQQVWCNFAALTRQAGVARKLPPSVQALLNGG